MDIMTALQLGLAAAGIWSLLCRISQMQPDRTRGAVFLQHGALAVGMALAGASTIDTYWLRSIGAGNWLIELLAVPHFGTTALMGAVVVYLLMGAPRWRDGAPAGTNKPSEPPSQGSGMPPMRVSSGSGS